MNPELIDIFAPLLMQVYGERNIHDRDTLIFYRKSAEYLLRHNNLDRALVEKIHELQKQIAILDPKTPADSETFDDEA